jgi:hypothetical protein
VSQFVPNIRTMDPPDVPDAQGNALLQSLARPLSVDVSGTPVHTLCWAFLSFGILPLLGLSRQFVGLARVEQLQFLHLAQWVGQHGQPPKASQELQAAALRLSPVWRINFVGFWLVVWGMGYFLVQVRQWGWAQYSLGHCLWISTYGYASQGWRRPQRDLFVDWNVALCLGFALHWMRVQWHAIQVHSFLERFNRVAVAEGLPAVMPAPLRSGLGWRWVLGAILLCGLGQAWWAAPMVLAAAAQRSYFRFTSRMDRTGLAHRLRQWMVRRRPGMEVPLPVLLRRTCPLPLCRAVVPDAALFCPRCGTHLPAALPRVA